MSKKKVGIWLIGAAGGVATTSIVALDALARANARGKTGGKGPDRAGHAASDITTALTSELPPFARLDLPGWGDWVVGGHEIRDISLPDAARSMAGPEGFLPAKYLEPAMASLEEIARRVRPGTIVGAGPTIAALAGPDVPREESAQDAVRRIQADIEQFMADEGLEHVVVVNVASTEPPIDADRLPHRWADVEALLDSPTCPLPASTLYAIAALKAEHADTTASYINFTPSLGSTPAAIGELVHLRQSRHMGCDGKTGETLLKSVLAPMFARRNLDVMSWVGHNIFGNLDGRVLDNPVNKSAKVRSKDHLLSEMLPRPPQTHVSIEYIESMGDWKTAWDHIHFRGLLGVPMTMQFIWQGCDSILAAPLVLDLARFTELARRRGHVGPMPFLASFFKSPYGVSEQAFDRQFAMLERWAEQE
jgi:myo-inositol-1-phosphate synthase